MVCFPPCKINLGLHIVSKRPDGYHNLETCFYPVPWTDVLEIIPAKEFSFTITGRLIEGSTKDNLCVKAYRLIQQHHVIGPVSIHLHKILPSGAGLGGGSSDAAFTLQLLNEIFELGLSIGTLKQYAARLGSDCAFFMEDKPMLGLERGDVLRGISVSLKSKYLVLVNPPVHVSTAEAYSQITPQRHEVGIPVILNTTMDEWRNNLVNDFEVSVFKQFPEIGRLKAKLYDLGAIYASMSGSGASVFGIFDKEVNLRVSFPESTYWSGFLTT